jgi:hypothetical protein
MNNAKIWKLIKERRELLAGTPEGNKFIYRIGGGSCYYLVLMPDGKHSIRGPVRKEIARAKVGQINRTSASTGMKAKYIGSRSALSAVNLL